MDFGAAFAIGSTLLSFVGGGKGDSTAGGGAMDIGGDTSGGIGSALGFIQKGAKAYNVMRGADTKNPQPFQTASAPETGKYYERFKQSGATQLSTPQAQTYAGYRNPDLSTAIANLVNNAQNTQMQQLMAQYSVVQPNKPINRQITRTEPSVLSSIGVG